MPSLLSHHTLRRAVGSCCNERHAVMLGDHQIIDLGESKGIQNPLQLAPDSFRTKRNTNEHSSREWLQTGHAFHLTREKEVPSRQPAGQTIFTRQIPLYYFSLPSLHCTNWKTRLLLGAFWIRTWGNGFTGNIKKECIARVLRSATFLYTIWHLHFSPVWTGLLSLRGGREGCSFAALYRGMDG